MAHITQKEYPDMKLFTIATILLMATASVAADRVVLFGEFTSTG